jgi:hypothetical protein
MTLAWKMDMQAGRKMVLLALCDSANDDGKCWPSIESLMQKCSMGERTVQQHVAAMEDADIIKRDMRAGRSTMYNIDPRKLCTPADSAPPQKLHPTPAENDGKPPQISHPTPADFAPRTVKEPKAEPKKKRKVARGTRLPSDWILKGKHAKAAAEIEPEWSEDEIRLIGDKFRDHWIAISGQRAVKVDWDATWRNWCRNEKKFGSAKTGARGGWWASDEKAITEGLRLGLETLPGESMYTFKTRIQAAVDNGGKPPAQVPTNKITAPPELPKGKRPEGMGSLKSFIKTTQPEAA